MPSYAILHLSLSLQVHTDLTYDWKWKCICKQLLPCHKYALLSWRKTKAPLGCTSATMPMLTSCAGGCNNMPGVRVMCDVGYLCANFSLPRPFCSRLRPDVCDRNTSSLNTRCHKGGGIISAPETQSLSISILTAIYQVNLG